MKKTPLVQCCGGCGLRTARSPNSIVDLDFFMHGTLIASVASAVVVGFAGIANAANVTSVNPPSIVLALQNAGYKAVLSKTDDGDPLIETASDGNAIQIIMTDCNNHKACTTTEFAGIWDCSDSVEECKKAALSANMEESPVHVIIINGGKTAVTYSYLIYDEVGISETLLVKNLTTFSHYNSQFTLAASKK